MARRKNLVIKKYCFGGKVLSMYFFTLLFSFSCHKEKGKNSPNPKVIIEKAEENTTIPEEIFIDSLNIGRKKANMVEVLKYRTIDSTYVRLNFYTKVKGKWQPRQTFKFLKDGITDCDPKISDFNNDKFGDLTVVSAIAARGANEIRRLFVYEKSGDKLIELKNSEEYPNMLYNEEVDCIDAFLVYRGCSTFFLEICGDSLREIATVDVDDGITVTEFDNMGEAKIILNDNTFDGDYIRFKTFKPLKKYPDF